LLTQPANVLVTRPEPKAQVLVSYLQEQGITASSQALFDYQNFTDTQTVSHALNTSDSIIFVSVAAVEFAHRNFPLVKNAKQSFFAVGKATQQALFKLSIKQVKTPSIENSEGLLALDELLTVKDQKITIFRGDGGREHLAQTLAKRGAKVNYVESYQRVWRTFPKSIAKQWQAQQINCIVVTSNAILTKLVDIIDAFNNANEATNDEVCSYKYWREKCTWLVASQRIADNALSLGLKHVINMNGASDSIISQQIKQL